MNGISSDIAHKDNPSEQALLAEYNACQLEANASGSYVFQMGSIFFVTTLALAGTVISYFVKADDSAYRLVLVILLGVFSIAALVTWKRYANRQHLIREVMYHRMRMIERKLDLRKNLYVHFLDDASEDTYENEIWLPLEKIERAALWEKYAKHRGRKPRGFHLVEKVAWFAIIAWAVLILLEVVRHFGCFH